MSCIVCGKFASKLFDELKFCDRCYSFNINNNDYSKNIEYEKPSYVVDGIYLGSQNSSIDREKLKELNIQYILIVGKGMRKLFSDIQYHIIEIDDSLEQDIREAVVSSLNIIKNWQQTGGNILIHCVSGISRSSSIVIAYLMNKYCYDFDDAYLYLKDKRKIINPNKNFVDQLKKMDLNNSGRLESIQ